MLTNKSLVDVVHFLLSKTVTIPLLAFVIYKTIQDPVTMSPDLKKDAEPFKAKEETEEKEKKESTLYIPPKENFDWSTTQPIKYRPFKKGEYKMVMGIHNIPPEDWLLVENTYKTYTDLKWSYVSNPELRDHGVFMADDCIPASIEFYKRATQFMLDRYPQCFEVEGDKIINKIRGDWIPRDPYSAKDKKDLHVYLSRFLEEDYIILYPDQERFNSDEYILKGGVFSFAAGFDPAERFQQPLTLIHGPVPEYKTKLRPQMNKFFDKLKPNVWVRRNNWSIQTHNRVFVMDENKGTEDEEIVSIDPETLDFKREVFFRSERQILTRLPESGAIVFTIRTYLTPMSHIRDEGLSEELIGGIEGMQGTIGQYKRRPAWGDAVIKFLKGETEGIEKPWIQGLQ
jgi:hypothetical protein